MILYIFLRLCCQGNHHELQCKLTFFAKVILVMIIKVYCTIFLFFFNATKLWNLPKNLHLKYQPEGISRKLFFIIACGSIIVGNDVAQVTPSILYRQAVFIIRRVERRSKAFPHINFQLLVLCWNVLKLLSLGLGGKGKKKICLASRGLVTGSI